MPSPPRPPPEIGQILFRDADFGVDLETRIGKARDEGRGRWIGGWIDGWMNRWMDG